MQARQQQITVLYDGACPICVQDRKFYQRLVGIKGEHIVWRDINSCQPLLDQHGISYQAAMQELHLLLDEQRVVKELDAYIILLGHIWWLKPLAWLIALPLIKPLLARYYHYRVNRRLQRSGRL